jgi:hypothetical protein
VNKTSPYSSFRFPWKKSQPNLQQSVAPVLPATEIEVDSELLVPGITGADLTLPIFDGLSTNPADHLIELETDSMEKYPDVRVYFWLVGDWDERARLDQHFPERSQNYEERLKEDERLVKAGRELLRQSRARGEGYVLSAPFDDHEPKN